MKHKIVTLLCIGTMVLSGCNKRTPKQDMAGRYIEMNTEAVSEDTGTEEPTITEPYIDDSVYIGEYLDSDVKEPNLEIAKGDDGKYIVQIGIYRLTSLSDGIGELTVEGMNFTATDAAGNPISGVITVKEETATVTFTNSTWHYLQNGSTFEYTKSSDIPNIWGQ